MSLWIQRLLTLIILAAGPTTAAAQDCCSGAVTSGAIYLNSPTCPGSDTQHVTEHTFKFEVSGTVSCNDGGWRQNTTNLPDFSDFSSVARGQCGIAYPNDPPQCTPSVDQAVYIGCSSQGVGVRAYVADSTYSGPNCALGNYEAVTQYSPFDGQCTGTYCCSFATECSTIGEWDQTNCRCYVSPIVVTLKGHPMAFSSPDSGPAFDLIPDGRPEVRSWPLEGVGFLVRDIDRNGVIDDGRELFGSVTEQPASLSRNGFDALKVLDVNKDGVIDRDDPAFAELAVWFDRNHNGRSDSWELESLSALGLRGIDLKYAVTRREDEYGNRYRYHAKLFLERSSQLHPRAWDVFLVSSRGCALTAGTR